MSQTARKFTHISAAEYLAAENHGSWRHEFVDGVVYAMAGASRWHNLIRSRLAATLLAHVAQGGGAFSAEMKPQVEDNEDQRYYYPDVFVSCDSHDREPHWRSTAVLVVEVLSPSTERTDRTEKFEVYERIPSVLQYGLLAQDAMDLELFRRRTDWQREFYRRDNTVTFESVGLTLNVSQLYRDVEFENRPCHRPPGARRRRRAMGGANGRLERPGDRR
jgi:Uma2 family endonuclease